MKCVKILYFISLIFSILASLNLGIVGVVDIDLIELIFNEQTFLMNGTYILMGLSGLYLAIYSLLVISNCKFCEAYLPKEEKSKII